MICGIPTSICNKYCHFGAQEGTNWDQEEEEKKKEDEYTKGKERISAKERQRRKLEQALMTLNESMFKKN